MKRMLNYTFFIMLFLNFSEGFRPVSVLLGLKSSSLVSGATLALSVLYIIVNRPIYRLLMKNSIFKMWYIFFIVHPVISLAFTVLLGYLSFGDFIYWISLNTMYGLLMVGAAIYALNHNFSSIKKMTLFAIIVAVIGFIVNYQNYAFSKKVLEFSSAGAAVQEELYRALSFFPHPNTAALSIVIYLILICSTADNQAHKPLYYVFFFLLCSSMVFITGSRTSIILLIVLAFFYMFPLLRVQISKSSKLSKSSVNVLIGCFFAFVLVIFYLLSNYISGIFGNLMSEDILGRMDFLYGGSGDDASLDDRTQIIPKYLAEISNNPIFGYGPQYVMDKLATNEFENVSQNAFIENAIIFGIPYSAFFAYLLYKSYKYSVSFINVRLDKSKALKIFILLLFLISFSINNLFWVRAVVVGLGFLFGNNMRERFLLVSAKTQETIQYDLEVKAVS